MGKDHTDEIFAKLERSVPDREAPPKYPDDYDTSLEPTPEEIEAREAAAQADRDEQYEFLRTLATRGAYAAAWRQSMNNLRRER